MSELRPDTDLTTRRAVLLAGAGGAGALVLAACSSGTSAGGGTSTRSSDGSLATLADITVGKCVSAELADGSPVIVARPTAASVACFSAICTHQGCTVSPAGATLTCPCHGSQFNALTGAVLQGPAASPLPKIPVTVTDGKVVART